MTDEAIEDTLEKVVKLLAYISDKDLFAEFYRKKLARRLLQDRSSSDEHERSILSRLKQQCGAQFTSKVCLPVACCLSLLLAWCILCGESSMTCSLTGIWNDNQHAVQLGHSSSSRNSCPKCYLLAGNFTMLRACALNFA